MAYTKTNWVNGVTPINAANLNNIESGLESAHNLIEGVNNKTRQDINFIGQNPLSTLEEDTVAFWHSKGSGIFELYGSGNITDQPTSAMLVHNLVADNGNVHQLAFQQRVGGIWHRGGNLESGWNGTWRRILDENSGIQIVKLWPNASPTSDFSAQTIGMDLTGYDFLLAELTSPRINYIIMINDVADNYYGFTTASLRYRNIKANSSGVTFGGGYYQSVLGGSSTASNAMMKPVTIYGFKGVL